MRWIAIDVLAIAFLLVGWTFRGELRDAWADVTKPALPAAQEYRPEGQETGENPAYVGTPAGRQEAEKTDAAILPPPASNLPTPSGDPLAWEGALPAETNLAVPFLLQAPHQNWDQPFGDACEEASLIMVDAFYRGRATNYGADEGAEAILEVVAYEDATYGYNKDTTTEDAAHTAREYFGYERVLVLPLTSPEDMKRVLANGYPIIVPAYGKALGNPNFRNGGPVYHMLVVKGYTKDGAWITNDPGTRRGADYIYSNDVLMNAIHTYNKEDMRKGAKEFIVVLPNS
jgi:hypothetical protein